MNLHVAADDRTGALEVAAALADRGREPVPVAVWPDRPPLRSGRGVVDLASRHVAPDEAAARASTLPGHGRLAHKIDSTLRGNWAVELSARHATTGRPVLLVPAFPALGRVCVGGTVLLDGRPVHEGPAGTDARGGLSSSRPADLLAQVGAPAVEIADRAALSAWLRGPFGIAVADAVDDAAIDEIVDRWQGFDDVILAGTSAVIGAAAGRSVRHVSRHVVQPPALVVCGSLHAAARRQVAHAAAFGAIVTDVFEPTVLQGMIEGKPVILRSPLVDGQVSAADAIAASARLVAEASAIVESGHVGTLIVIGGDTAAELLGDALVVVHGSVRPGTALIESLIVEVPVISRAGGFGADDALSDLLWDRLPA